MSRQSFSCCRERWSAEATSHHPGDKRLLGHAGDEVLGVKVYFSDRFQDEWLALAKPLQKRCSVMVKELRDWSLDDLGRAFKNKNPWRIHRLKASSMTSLSLDMNYRVLAKIRGDNIWCLRAVPHNVADRPRVNRNESQDAFVELSGVQLKPSELYEALRVFGLSGSEVERFRECSTEDDLLEAAAEVSPHISDFALDLYGSSGLAIPKARYRSFHRDETFDNAILNPDSSDWVLYLHLWVANYYSARNPLRLSSLVILGVVARMFRCATRSSCWCT